MKQYLLNLPAKLKKANYLLLIIAVFLALGGLFFSYKYYEFQTQSTDEKIGWVTDIHAGKNKRRTMIDEDGTENTLYPKRYEEVFDSAIKKMKEEGVKTIITTGDNTNLSEPKFAEKLKKIQENNKSDIVCVRGNHDFLPEKKIDVMPKLGVNEYFYVRDTKDARIIVLDINFNGPNLSEENLKWLKEKLDETNLSVIIAAHSPIINYATTSFYEPYLKLGEMLESSGKVKFVISGHTHKEAAADKNGIKYQTAWPLTQKNHMGSFYVIDVKNNKIEHYENYSFYEFINEILQIITRKDNR